METQTIHCKHCGEANDTGTSICVNCLTPLTAYGGQVGQEEKYVGRLSEQVAALEQRPAVVPAVVGFQLFYAFAVPLWTVIHGWATRPQTNEEGTNAIQAAGGVFANIAHTLVLVPLAIALMVVAYFTWIQREWAWKANHAVFAVIAITPILLQGFVPATWFWIFLVVVFEVLWNQSSVKAWYAAE